MQFDEMGNKSGKTMLLLPGTACDYQTNFGSVLDALGEKYHLICVNYDGFDGSDLIFPDMLTVTEKIEQYIKEHFDGDPSEAVLCSNFVGEALDYSYETGFRSIILIGHLGKFVKLAGGIMNTHSHNADSRMEILSANAALETENIEFKEGFTEEESYTFWNHLLEE